MFLVVLPIFGPNRHTPFHLQQAANTAAQGGNHDHPDALIDYGVQAAIDAHQLIFSLRSEVSALERHNATLQTNLDRLEDASVATINGTATATAWTAYTVATPKEREGVIVSTSIDDPGEKLAGAEGGTRKRVRAERRKHAAEVLRQALGDGDESATPRVAAGGEEARALGLAREARQRAQETFVSRGVGAAIATVPVGAGGGTGKRVRAERREHAAEILRQALGDDGGSESATPGVEVEGKARAAGLTPEARQRAQEA